MRCANRRHRHNYDRELQAFRLMQRHYFNRVHRFGIVINALFYLSPHPTTPKIQRRLERVSRGKIERFIKKKLQIRIIVLELDKSQLFRLLVPEYQESKNRSFGIAYPTIMKLFVQIAIDRF